MSRKYKKITELKTYTGKNYRITISKQTAEKFSEIKFSEKIIPQGIMLVKSGCEYNE